MHSRCILLNVPIFLNLLDQSFLNSSHTLNRDLLSRSRQEQPQDTYAVQQVRQLFMYFLASCVSSLGSSLCGICLCLQTQSYTDNRSPHNLHQRDRMIGGESNQHKGPAFAAQETGKLGVMWTVGIYEKLGEIFTNTTCSRVRIFQLVLLLVLYGYLKGSVDSILTTKKTINCSEK